MLFHCEPPLEPLLHLSAFLIDLSQQTSKPSVWELWAPLCRTSDRTESPVCANVLPPLSISGQVHSTNNACWWPRNGFCRWHIFLQFSGQCSFVCFAEKSTTVCECPWQWPQYMCKNNSNLQLSALGYNDHLSKICFLQVLFLLCIMEFQSGCSQEMFWTNINYTNTWILSITQTNGIPT